MRRRWKLSAFFATFKDNPDLMFGNFVRFKIIIEKYAYFLPISEKICISPPFLSLMIFFSQKSLFGYIFSQGGGGRNFIHPWTSIEDTKRSIFGPCLLFFGAGLYGKPWLLFNGIAEFDVMYSIYCIQDYVDPAIKKGNIKKKVLRIYYYNRFNQDFKNIYICLFSRLV